MSDYIAVIVLVLLIVITFYWTITMLLDIKNFILSCINKKIKMRENLIEMLENKGDKND